MGDRIVLGVQADRDCYLTLINEGTSGQQVVLFPNDYDRSTLISGGIPYWFPNPGHPFDFQLQGPPGTEVVRALATLDPLWRYDLDLDANLAALSTQGYVEARCVIAVRA